MAETMKPFAWMRPKAVRMLLDPRFCRVQVQTVLRATKIEEDAIPVFTADQLAQARREERERIAKWFETSERPYVAEIIRALPVEGE